MAPRALSPGTRFALRRRVKVAEDYRPVVEEWVQPPRQRSREHTNQPLAPRLEDLFSAAAARNRPGTDRD